MEQVLAEVGKRPVPEQYVTEYLPDVDAISLSQVNWLSGMQDDIPVTYTPRLPPLLEIQPAIDAYFDNVNTLLPLFSRTEFTRMVSDYYASVHPRPRVAWAAVNVVLALATRLPDQPSSALDLGSGDSQVSAYVNNAQSVLAEIVTDVDLLSIQVVLGLVVVFHALKDPRSALVLVGTAVRLAHTLRLHTRQEGLLPEEELQRDRVFWIAYLFDRDICLRNHVPSAQDNADIDLDLPSENPLDGAGDVFSIDGSVRVNFFRTRLWLAHIQGRVFELLFASRAARISAEDRRARVAFLHQQLHNWKQALPAEMHADAVADNVDRSALFWLCMMHFSYLGCLVMVHGIWSHDADWRKRLVLTERGETAPPLPSGWENCVDASRACMCLMSRMHLSDASVW